MYKLATNAGCSTRSQSRSVTKNRAMGENNLITSQKKRGTFNTRQSPHTLMRFFLSKYLPPPPQCQLDVSRLSHSDRVTMPPTHPLHMGPIKQGSHRDLGVADCGHHPHATFVTLTLFKVVQESRYF